MGVNGAEKAGTEREIGDGTDTHRCSFLASVFSAYLLEFPWRARFGSSQGFLSRDSHREIVTRALAHLDVGTRSVGGTGVGVCELANHVYASTLTLLQVRDASWLFIVVQVSSMHNAR